MTSPAAGARALSLLQPAATDQASRETAVEAAMLDRLVQGDVAALDAVLTRFWSPLLKYLIGLLGSREAAEDIAQETFFRLWQRRAMLRAEGSLRGFIYQVARNLAISEQRRARVSARAANAMSQDEIAVAYVDFKDDHPELERAISALPQRRREILLLHSVHGLSYKEIAGLLGIAPQTVANQFSSALASLRLALLSKPMV
jgi:RNA polymerase sigma-70 factor (ECF subfamily)